MVMVDNLITNTLNEKDTSKTMAQAKRKSEARTSSKKAPDIKERNYQQTNRPIMRPTTNLEYKPRPSRWKTDQHAKDEQQLAAIAIMVAIVTGLALYLSVSGIANRFIENASDIIRFII